MRAWCTRRVLRDCAAHREAITDSCADILHQHGAVCRPVALPELNAVVAAVRVPISLEVECAPHDGEALLHMTYARRLRPGHRQSGRDGCEEAARARSCRCAHRIAPGAARTNVFHHHRAVCRPVALPELGSVGAVVGLEKQLVVEDDETFLALRAQHVCDPQATIRSTLTCEVRASGRALCDSAARTASLPALPVRMSFNMTVPAAVPSLFHSSVPCSAVSAWKKTCPRSDATAINSRFWHVVWCGFGSSCTGSPNCCVFNQAI